MSLRPLYGHADLRRRLAHSLHADRLPASLLLQGPRGVGKQRLALWLGQLLLCARARDEQLDEPCGECTNCRYAVRVQHPDLHWFFPRPKLKDADSAPEDIAADLAEAIAERVQAEGLWEPTSGTEAIFVATMRALVRQATLKPAMASRAVFVVGDAERMVAQEGADAAANAFLKLLEEPPPHTTLILTSSESGALLPTIRSRVSTVRVAPLSAEAVEQFVHDAVVQRRFAGVSGRELIARAGGSPGTLLSSTEDAHAIANATRMLDAALLPAGPDGDVERMKMATRQGVAGARGAFSDSLDAMIRLLHQQARALVAAGRDVDARRRAEAIPAVEAAKLRAQGNVNPQLLAASLMSTLHHRMRP